MKFMRKLLIVCTSLLILFACEQPEDEVQTEIEDSESFWFGKHRKSKKKVIPFYSKLVTSMTPTDETGNCEAPFDFFNNQEGEGIIFPFGKFTTKITFCVNISTLEYKDGVGTFFMANGDELYLTVAGQILPSEDPEYDLQFQDKFYFTGGTGKFEGASGWGVTDSYVHLFPEGGDQTDHIWKGVLILPKSHDRRWSD